MKLLIALTTMILIGTYRDCQRFPFKPSVEVHDAKARHRYQKWEGSLYYQAAWAYRAQQVHRDLQDWPLITVVIGRYQSNPDIIADSDIFQPWTINGTVTCDYRRLRRCERVIKATLGPNFRRVNKLRR